MKRKILSMVLMVSLIFSMIGQVALANVQIPVDKVIINEVYFVEGENVITREPIIRPTMTVSWEEPNEWGGDPNITDIHSPDFYDIIVENITRGTQNTIRVDSGSTEFNNRQIDLHEEVNIDTGSLYNVIVKPYHYHLIEDGTGYELAQESGVAESAYAITDLNLEFVSSENSIQVIWDDLGSPEFQYRIVYAIGDYTNRSKQDILDNKEGEIGSITSESDGVEKFYDPIQKRNKLSYTIDENIYPGQVYSIMIEPLVEYFNSELVMRNRNYPYIQSCSTNVQLDLFEEGDYIRLGWNIPSRFKVGQDRDEYALVEATLVEYQDGQGRNVAIFDGDAAVIGYYKVPKPNQESEYQIKFVYKAVDDQSKPSIEPESNIVAYVPSELLITPTMPIVPKLFSEEILDDLKSTYTNEEIRTILADKYLVPGYTFTGVLDNILSQNVTFHIDEDVATVNLVWGAFQRIDVNETSPTYNEYIYDDNVYYDIWVTKSLDAMNYAIPVIEDKRYGTGTPSNVIYEDGKICGYSQELQQYYNDTTGELVDIEPNEIYYIKILARKKVANGELLSDPTVVTVYYGYGGDIFEPPTIAKPPLKVKDSETTSDGITLTWEEAWWEIISPDASPGDALAIWQHEVWVEDAGSGTVNIYGDKVNNAKYFPIYKGATEITRLENYLRTLGAPMTLKAREVNLGEDAYGVSDVRYKFCRIPYTEVQNQIIAGQQIDPTYTFNDYYQELIEADKNGTKPLGWNDIIPGVESTDGEQLRYREEGLLPNTSYLFLVYPYRTLYTGELLMAHYPTPIAVSTDPEDTVIVPDPIVPNLYVSNYSDTSISVTWKYNEDFVYELVYSLYEDISTAKEVEWDIPDDIHDPLYPVNGEYYEVKIDDLFPDTEYYFWIRAIQTATSATSHWSNSVFGKTRDVNHPIPPRGVGIASEENMKLHGYEESVTDEYLTIEWILDANDKFIDSGNPSEQNVTTTYSYIIEVADNSKFIDPQYIESSGGLFDSVPGNVELLEKNMVKIKELIPNRPYYIRIKTRVTVEGTEEGQLIVKDSLTYSPTIKIITITTGDEYDGIIDPALEILPGKDYEIIYNPKNNELEFRFRDDLDGDNNVDQRLISQLIARNIYEYLIPIASFDNKPISKRIITIPYSIIEAFNEYKVDIVIDAGEIILDMPYGALSSELNRQVSQYGTAPYIRIEIEPLDAYHTVEQMPDQAIKSVAIPQDINVKVKSDKLTKLLNYSDKVLTVNLKTNNRYELYGKDSVVYTKDYKYDWVETSSVFDKYNGYITFKTSKLGAYGAYVLESRNQNIVLENGHWSEKYREDVFEKYNIEGLDHYDPENKVSEQAIINIIYSMITNERNIDLDAYISNSITNILKQAGVKENISKNQKTITRQEAINMFVRAYEIMNEETITIDSIILSEVNADKTISNQYKKGIAKAAIIGLVSDVSKVRADDPINYAEIFTIWSKLEQKRGR